LSASEPSARWPPACSASTFWTRPPLSLSTRQATTWRAPALPYAMRFSTRLFA
jgi:hypothetical protein